MKLIIVIICLLLERYVGVGAMLGRSKILNSCFSTMRSVLSKSGVLKGMMGVAILALGLPLLVGMLIMLLGGLFSSLIGLFLGIAVLLLSMGPEEFYSIYNKYLTAKAGNDPAGAVSAATEVLGHEPSSDGVAQSREMTLGAFARFSDGVFAPAFWFAILGPFGALAYRFSACLAKEASANDPTGSMAEPAAQMFAWLEWLPLRVLGLCTALVGEMKASLNFWLERLMKGASQNRELMKAYVLNALGTSDEDAGDASLEENKAVMDLLDKSMYVLVGLVAVLSFFSFVF